MTGAMRRPTTAILILMGGLGAFGSGMEIQVMQGATALPAPMGRMLLLSHFLAALLSLGPSSWVFLVPSVEKRLRGSDGLLAYYALVALGALLGAGVLQTFWVVVGQRSWNSPALLVDVAFLLATNLSIVWFATRDAAARSAVAQGKVQLEDTLRSLESVRMLNSLGPKERNAAVLGTLERRIAPALEELLQQLEELRQEDPATARAKLQLLMDRLEHLRETEVRLLSHQLHPSIIDVGMAPAFHGLADRLRPRLRLELDLPFASPGEPPLETRLLFFRAAEQALEAMRRRPAVTRATLSWKDAGDAWEMAIRHEGAAPESSSIPPDIGLHLLAGRVELARGSWKLETEPGRGTLFEVRIPKAGRTGSPAPTRGPA